MRAQPGEMRRLGVVMSVLHDDPGGITDVAALRQGLADFGWVEGRNIQIELRWALAAHAQQSDRMRRVGILESFTESNLVAQAYITAFRLEVSRLGWMDGRNVRFDYRWDARASNGKVGISAA